MSQPASERVVRRKELKYITGLSASTSDRLEKAGKFPQRIHLSDNTVGWFLSQIQSWMASLSK